jgi:DNA-directed RNA polymerase specialized sigma24 family protein
MSTNRFTPSRLRVPDQLEEVLLRAVLARCESPVPVLAYLVSLGRHLNPAAFPVHWLDLPLRRLADLVQDILSAQRTLSANSAAGYLDTLRYQLDRSRSRTAVGFNARLVSARCWGDVPLRNFTGQDADADFESLASQAARLLSGVRLRWQSHAVFEKFARARLKDLQIFLRAKHAITETLAAELTQRTLARVWRRRHKFDPRRGRFVAFTFHESEYVWRDYWREMRDQIAREQSLDPLNEGLDEVDRSFAAASATEPDPDRAVMQLRFTELLFRLEKPPHQIIVFIRCRLLGMPPAKILTTYAHLPLLEFARLAERDFLHESGLPDEVIRAGFAHMYARLQLPLEQLVRGEMHLEKLGPLAGLRAGDVCLGEYLLAGNSHGRSSRVEPGDHTVSSLQPAHLPAPGGDDAAQGPPGKVVQPGKQPADAELLTRAWNSVQKKLTTIACQWFPERQPKPAVTQKKQEIPRQKRKPRVKRALCLGQGRKKDRLPSPAKARRRGSPPNT